MSSMLTPLSISQDISQSSDLKNKCPFSINSTFSFTCNYNGGVLTSKYGDIKITVPVGAIRSGNVVKFYVATDMYGLFFLPSECQNRLVSPYYWIGVAESYLFQKPVQVEFEHFSVVVDPSHYQLLSCEDDDKSYTMRPVDCNLGIKLQDGKSWFTYLTNHLCSYCLIHKIKGPMISRISVFCLKPKNFQYLSDFKVEMWFCLPLSCCVQRNKELYTMKGLILNEDGDHTFEASCDPSSKSYFSFNYIQNLDGWVLSHSLSRKILTKEINFYNHYKSEKDLCASEENSLYPPRFVFHVKKISDCTSDLDTDIMITLTDENEHISFKHFKLVVPQALSDHIVPAGGPEKQFKVDKRLQNKSAVTSVASPRPNFKKLMKYLEQVPDIALNYFIVCLLSKESAIEVIKDIRRSNESKVINIMKVCESFLKEKDASWAKLYDALKYAECDDLADMVKAEIGMHMHTLSFNLACMYVTSIQASVWTFACIATVCILQLICNASTTFIICYLLFSPFMWVVIVIKGFRFFVIILFIIKYHST